MRSRRDKDQLVFEKWLALNFVASRRTLDEAQLDLLLFYSIDNVLGVATDQCRMNARILLAELAQKTRQDILRDGRGSPQVKLPCVVAGEGYDIVLNPNEKRINLLRVRRSTLPAGVSAICAPVRSNT